MFTFYYDSEEVKNEEFPLIFAQKKIEKCLLDVKTCSK